MESFGLEQIVKSPTRITDHSETLIDHIYCNNLRNVLLTKGGTSQYNLNRIFRLPKKAVKIIVNYQYDNIANSMDELKVLPYEHIFLRNAKFMFKISKSVLPSYVNQMFSFRPFNETLQSLLKISRCIGFLYSKATERNFQTKLNLFRSNLLVCLKNLETVDIVLNP